MQNTEQSLQNVFKIQICITFKRFVFKIQDTLYLYVKFFLKSIKIQNTKTFPKILGLKWRWRKHELPSVNLQPFLSTSKAGLGKILLKNTKHKSHSENCI